MKIIGLIGGMSWESSSEYYRIINERIREKLGGLHSAKCLMYSVDFEEVEKLQQQEKWGEAAKIMMDAARRIERGGADFVVICTNTMHKLVEEMQPMIRIPILHRNGNRHPHGHAHAGPCKNAPAREYEPGRRCPRRNSQHVASGPAARNCARVRGEGCHA
jgi:hypothetical protein